MNKALLSRLGFVLSMTVFSTIGIFVKFINLPSGFIAMARGIIGAICLFLFAIFSKTEINLKNIRSNLLALMVSGAAIGFNWIFLFEAYRYTAVSIATLCYYMAPVFVMLISPLIFKERLTATKVICIILSLVGMVFVSGVLEGSLPETTELLGIAFGLGAAVLYAFVVVLNKKITNISAHNKTFIQLFTAGVVVLPYTLFAERLTANIFNTTGILLLLVVGILHTGIAYLIYFGAVSSLPSSTVAVLSYIDPALAIILSAIILSEDIGLAAIGAVLILGSALLSEIPPQKRKK